MYKYYIFDFDNTLCDSLTASQLTYREVFNHFNLHYTDSDIATFIGEALEETYKNFSSPVFSFEDFSSYFFQVSDRIMPDHIKIFYTALELLSTLKLLGKKIIIVTSKNRSTLRLILIKNHIEDLFDCIITYEDVKNHKPDPEGIELCLSLLAVENKQTAVYIGDSLNDKKAALSAGISFIGVSIIEKTNIAFEVTDLRMITLPLLLSTLLTNEVNESNKSHSFSDDCDLLLDRVISTKNKFRKGHKPSDEVLANIKIKIQNAMRKQEPISFSVPFGAYKGWQIEAEDYPDWAEIFHLSHMYAYAQDIVNVYKHGVIINYTYQDNLISHISNRSPNVNRDYTKIFSILLEMFSAFNNRIQFKLVAINGLYKNEKDYYGEFIDNLFDVFVEFLKNILDTKNNHIPYQNFYELVVQGNHDEAIALVHNSDISAFSKFQSGLNNYCINGYSKDTNYSEKSIQERVIRSMVSALMIESVDLLSLRKEFNKYSDNVQLVFDKRPTNSIFIGTTKNSVKSFWAGKGVVLSINGKLFPTVISQKEWVGIKNGQAVKLNGDRIAKRYRIDYIPVELPVSKLCNNFSNITVLTAFNNL